MSNNKRRVTKKKVVKRRIKKSRVIIATLLLGISIFSIGYTAKNVLNTAQSSASSKEKEKTNESKDVKEIEQLTLENEEVGKKFKIVIDPGHGGDDKGRESFSKKNLEKNISLSIGKKVASKLSQYKDIEVILTRSEDINLSVENRIEKANSQNADVFLAIHLNGEYKGNTANGIETYYQKESIDNSGKLAKSIQDTVCLYLETRNRGVLATNMDLLKNTTMPSAWIEAGFITNEKEEKKLMSNSYQEKMAEGIAQGILSYIDSTK